MIDWKAVAATQVHETQIKILDYIAENGSASAVVLDRLWYRDKDKPSMLSQVGYHMKALRDRGLLKIQTENKRRGAIENINVLTPLAKGES